MLSARMLAVFPVRRVRSYAAPFKPEEKAGPLVSRLLTYKSELPPYSRCVLVVVIALVVVLTLTHRQKI